MATDRPSRRVAALAGAAIAAIIYGLFAYPAAADDIVITDQEGREVRLPQAAERIVTIPMPMASGVIALDGSANKLVGLNPLSLTAIREGILGKIFPDAASPRG